MIRAKQFRDVLMKESVPEAGAVHPDISNTRMTPCDLCKAACDQRLVCVVWKDQGEKVKDTNMVQQLQCCPVIYPDQRVLSKVPVVPCCQTTTLLSSVFNFRLLNVLQEGLLIPDIVFRAGWTDGHVVDFFYLMCVHLL